MNVLLVFVSTTGVKEEKSFPLGVLQVAAYARATRDARVSIEDMQFHINDFERVVARVKRERPDVVGISSTSIAAPGTTHLAARIKQEHPQAIVVIGGSHPTSYPEETVEQMNVDYVIRGEGELAFGKLIDAIRNGGDASGVPNCWAGRGAGAVRNEIGPLIEDLDSLPFPAYDAIDMTRYWDANLPRLGVIYKNLQYASVTSTRGCPYKCIYCHNTHYGKVRFFGVDYMMEELTWLRDRFGVREVAFIDDIFNANPERTRQFARAMIDRRLNLSFFFPIGLRADLLDRDIIALLREAGMYRMLVALESGSPRIQELMRKNLKLEKVEAAVTAAAEMGVLTAGTFMIGFPTETMAEMRATVNLAVRSDLHSAAFLRVIPFKNTELFELARKVGKTDFEDMDKLSMLSTTINLTDIPTWKVAALKKWAYLRFYVSPRRAWRVLRALPHPAQQIPRILGFLFRKAFLW